jgi:hypothetical protein
MRCPDFRDGLARIPPWVPSAIRKPTAPMRGTTEGAPPIRSAAIAAMAPASTRSGQRVESTECRNSDEQHDRQNDESEKGEPSPNADACATSVNATIAPGSVERNIPARLNDSLHASGRDANRLQCSD